MASIVDSANKDCAKGDEYLWPALAASKKSLTHPVSHSLSHSINIATDQSFAQYLQKESQQ